jgi:hypothetical protein
MVRIEAQAGFHGLVAMLFPGSGSYAAHFAKIL